MLILALWHLDQNQLLADSKHRLGGMQISSHQKQYPEGSLGAKSMSRWYCCACETKQIFLPAQQIRIHHVALYHFSLLKQTFCHSLSLTREDALF